MFHSALGVFITVQVMTVTWQSACHHNAIGSDFESLKGHQYIQLARTGKLNNLYRWGILQPQSPSQIGRCVSAMFATVGDYLKCRFLIHDIASLTSNKEPVFASLIVWALLPLDKPAYTTGAGVSC